MRRLGLVAAAFVLVASGCGDEFSVDSGVGNGATAAPQPAEDLAVAQGAESPLPGVVIVDQLVEGFAESGEVWVECPAGKQGIGWGFEHNKNDQMWHITEARPWSGPELWRFGWTVDPLYAQVITPDQSADARRNYHTWFYLVCVDVAGASAHIEKMAVENYPSDCASIPACQIWGE